MSRQYNKKMKPQEFQIGDLVLKENSRNQTIREKKGKFEANWLGPYVITAVFGSGAYQLSTSNGEVLDTPINSLHLKNFLHLLILKSFSMICYYGHRNTISIDNIIQFKHENLLSSSIY